MIKADSWSEAMFGTIENLSKIEDPTAVQWTPITEQYFQNHLADQKVTIETARLPASANLADDEEFIKISNSELKKENELNDEEIYMYLRVKKDCLKVHNKFII